MEDACRRMASLGFDGFEIWKPQLAEVKTPELLKQFVEFTNKRGIRVCALNNVDSETFLPFSSSNSFERTLQGMKEDSELADLLGVRDVLVWEGVRPRGNNKSDEELLKVAIRLFKEAIRLSEKEKTRFLVEPHPFSLGMNLDYLTRLSDSLDKKRFGILYDSCHFGVGKPEEYIESIRSLGKRIKHIHFADSDQRTSELHYPLGTGKLDLDGIVEALAEVGFSGTISLDTFGYPLPEEASRISLPILKKALARLGLD